MVNVTSVTHTLICVETHLCLTKITHGPQCKGHYCLTTGEIVSKYESIFIKCQPNVVYTTPYKFCYPQYSRMSETSALLLKN